MFNEFSNDLIGKHRKNLSMRDAERVKTIIFLLFFLEQPSCKLAGEACGLFPANVPASLHEGK
jgi:hypothetical protein